MVNNFLDQFFAHHSCMQVQHMNISSKAVSNINLLIHSNVKNKIRKNRKRHKNMGNYLLTITWVGCGCICGDEKERGTGLIGIKH